MINDLHFRKYPIGKKSIFGPIPELSEIPEHLRKRMTEKCLPGDRVVVTVKLDGFGVAAANVGGQILALCKDGLAANRSPLEAMYEWCGWVRSNTALLADVIEPGEVLVGEWLWQAVGTRYDLPHGPFVAVGIIGKHGNQIPYSEFADRVEDDLPCADCVWDAERAASEEEVMREFQIGYEAHGHIDAPEGFVWRLESNGKTVFAQAQRGDYSKRYLPWVSHQPAVLNSYALKVADCP